MSSRFYRLRRETISTIAAENGEEKALALIPGGSVIEAPAVLPQTTTVRILWSGKAFDVFNVDLKERGELLSSPGE